MAELSHDKVFKAGVMVRTVKEHAEVLNVTGPSVDYAISKGLVDYIKIGSTRFIVLNEKTQSYEPRGDIRRKTRMEL
jgi:hypothetical protein